MGTREDGLFTMGQIIFYTNKTIALMIKPSNGEDLWEVGLFLKYLNDSKENCIIVDKDGKEFKCPLYMIQKMC